jgi:hypothetical protein
VVADAGSKITQPSFVEAIQALGATEVKAQIVVILGLNKHTLKNPGLDVPANRSPACPAVNATATANHAPKGGRK